MLGAAQISEGLTTGHPRKGLGRVHCAHARGCHGAMVLVLQWLPGHYRSQAKVACLDAVGSCLGGTDSRDEYGSHQAMATGGEAHHRAHLAKGNAVQATR